MVKAGNKKEPDYAHCKLLLQNKDIIDVDFSTFDCDKCVKKYPTKRGLQKHKNVHAETDEENTEQINMSSESEDAPLDESRLVDFDENILIMNDNTKFKICARCDEDTNEHVDENKCPIELIKVSESRRKKIHFHEVFGER